MCLLEVVGLRPGTPLETGHPEATQENGGNGQQGTDAEVTLSGVPMNECIFAVPEPV